jgi:hypothetical protein
MIDIDTSEFTLSMDSLISTCYSDSKLGIFNKLSLGVAASPEFLLLGSDLPFKISLVFMLMSHLNPFSYPLTNFKIFSLI